MNDYQKGYITALEDFAKMIKNHLNTPEHIDALLCELVTHWQPLPEAPND